MNWLLKLRKILGALTDALIKGRQAGLWDRKNGPPGGPTR